MIRMIFIGLLLLNVLPQYAVLFSLLELRSLSRISIIEKVHRMEIQPYLTHVPRNCLTNKSIEV